MTNHCDAQTGSVLLWLVAKYNVAGCEVTCGGVMWLVARCHVMSCDVMSFDVM